MLTFDATLTLPDDVCCVCNSKVLGPLDDRLADLVRRFVYLDHDDVAPKPSPLRQGLKIFLADAGIWVSAWLGRAHEVRIPPQFIFMSGGDVRFEADKSIGGACATLLASIQEELKLGASLNIDEELLQGREPAIQPALIRTAPRTYVVRGQDQNEINEIRAAVTSGTLSINISASSPDLATTSSPVITGHLKADLGAAERAIAKIALNFTCFALGPEAARCQRFNAIRRFITAPYESETGGFVQSLFGDSLPEGTRRSSEAMARPGRHTLFLAVAGGVPLVALTLYGRPFALVHLTQEAHPHPYDPMASVLAIFDYGNRSHEILRIREDIIRFGKALYPPLL